MCSAVRKKKEEKKQTIKNNYLKLEKTNEEKKTLKEETEVMT